MTSRHAGPGYVPGAQRAMGGGAGFRPGTTTTIKGDYFYFNGQKLNLNSLRQQSNAYTKKLKKQSDAYVANLKKMMAETPANYGYDAATNAKLDAYIKNKGKGTPEDYGLGAKLLNTPGFEDPLGREAARINARKTALSPEVQAKAKQQYEDIRNVAMEQSRAFNEKHNPHLKKKREQQRLLEEKRKNDKIRRTRESSDTSDGEWKPRETNEAGEQMWRYKGKKYTYKELTKLRQQEYLERHKDQEWDGRQWVDKRDTSTVQNAVAEVTDSQEARNQDDFSGASNASFQYELQRPPDQLYYIQSLGQCLNRKYSGSGVFVDD